MTDFSPREIEVLRLLAAGKRNVEIATELGVKPRTLSQFKARAAKKLGLDHPTDIALVNAASAAGALDFKHTTKFDVSASQPAPALIVQADPDAPTPIGPVDAGPYLPADAPKWADTDLVVVVAEYPGTPNWDHWKSALPNIQARLEDGVDYNRLRLIAMKYRRQHAAQTARAVDEIRAQMVAAGFPDDVDAARRQQRKNPVPIISPADMFEADGKWRSSFPVPAFEEIPPEPIDGVSE